MKSNFHEPYQILFKSSEIELELEDDVRLELFLDNLQLHRHYSETNSALNGGTSRVTCNRYLKKILKLLIQWECKLLNTEELADTSMLVFYSILIILNHFAFKLNCYF
jgi:hypothetical protein